MFSTLLWCDTPRMAQSWSLITFKPCSPQKNGCHFWIPGEILRPLHKLHFYLIIFWIFSYFPLRNLPVNIGKILTMSSEGNYEWKTGVVNETKFQHQIFWSSIQCYGGLIYLLGLTSSVVCRFSCHESEKVSRFQTGINRLYPTSRELRKQIDFFRGFHQWVSIRVKFSAISNDTDQECSFFRLNLYPNMQDFQKVNRM